MASVVKSAMGAINFGLAARAILLTGRAHPLLILANAPMVFRAARWGVRRLARWRLRKAR
jgi:hypothetical protein